MLACQWVGAADVDGDEWYCFSLELVYAIDDYGVVEADECQVGSILGDC